MAKQKSINTHTLTGLQPYSAYYSELLLLPDRSRSFAELERVMRPRCYQRLREVYDDADDVDLFVGGLCERPMRNALVGPTFAHLIAEQFRRTKLADRHWFERSGQFTSAQLKQLRARTLAAVLCDNSDVVRVHRKVMQVQRKRRDPFVDCAQQPKLDLKAFVDLVRSYLRRGQVGRGWVRKPDLSLGHSK